MALTLSSKGGESPDLLIVATGAEVWLALNSATALKDDGIHARVVSMPSWKIFEEQTAEYKASIFPDHLPKLSIEAGATLGWWKYVGRHGDVIGLDRFGASLAGPDRNGEAGLQRGQHRRQSGKKLAGK
jgi:transketolase